MGLYDAVRREEKPRRRHPMWVVALAFAAALVTALGLTISKPPSSEAFPASNMRFFRLLTVNRKSAHTSRFPLPVPCRSSSSPPISGIMTGSSAA